MTGNYTNLFDAQSELYAQYRPSYPSELFQFIVQHAPGRTMAWDAGCGNGQAAVALADYFAAVIATDSSDSQIRYAKPRTGISYHARPAEDSQLDSESCELVSAANAVHWFDIPRFFSEVQRVLVPNGVVAIWCYSNVFADAEFEATLKPLKDAIASYWPEPNQLVFHQYKTINFPFEEIEAPEFQMEVSWPASKCIGYFSTWSAVERYKKETGQDPITQWRSDNAELCADENRKFKLTFPLHLRIGRKI